MTIRPYEEELQVWSSYHYDEWSPPPPNPSDFGIDDAYILRLEEGQAEWERRKLKRNDYPTGVAIAFLGVILGTALIVWVTNDYDWWDAIGGGFFAMMGGGVVFGLIAEARVKRKNASTLAEIQQEYNPKATQMAAFKEAYDLYRHNVTPVNVSQNGLFHDYKYCSGMIYSTPMTRIEALTRGYSPCTKCSTGFIRQTVLPDIFYTFSP